MSHLQAAKAQLLYTTPGMRKGQRPQTVVTDQKQNWSHISKNEPSCVHKHTCIAK